MEIIDNALKKGQTTLSEHESKSILSSYGIPVTREMLVEHTDDVLRVANEIGYPVVMKGCAP
ncbi:MAG: acetate--CoA ligase family protein, partial [Deltaproteobacteria bacterium]|nr:acetate--CoA ligase family protein [Deltaproteobacteria bacterium]